jgi:hypothetical protein
MILNGIEAMGNNIMKAINSEIQAMSAHMDVLNQASLDAIMNKLNTSSYAKETSKPRTADYTMPSESPSIPNPKPGPSRPKDEKESKNSPPTPMPPGRNGPKCPPFPNPGPTSRGHPRWPDPGGSNDNDSGGGGGSRRLPAGGDPGDNSDPDDNPGLDNNPEMDREGDSPSLGCSAMPAGYDWSQLDMSAWDPNPKCIWTLSERISETHNNTFRGRIHEAIRDTARDVLKHTPITSGTYVYLKTIVTGMPMPLYSGEDDLEVFMTWIHSLMCFYDIHQIVGQENDHNRTTILCAVLKDRAQTWYDMSIRMGMHGLHAFPPAFIMILLKLAEMFVMPAAVTKAQCSFDKIAYTKDKGIRAYVRKLQMISKHILLPINEYTLRKQIVKVIPLTIWNSLIDLKGLSTSTLSVAEWVEAIARWERELLKKAAFDDAYTNPTRFGTATMRRQPAWVTVAANRPTSDQHKQSSSDVWSNECAKPTGPTVQPCQPIVLAEVTCHACGKKGHYCGLKECLKTPSLACIHALGLENEPGEETPHDDHIEEEEIPFEGPEFDGDADLDLVIYESEDNISLGAIVTNFHIASESSDEVDIAQMAQLATTGETECNQKITNELVSSSTKHEGVVSKTPSVGHQPNS